MYQNCLEQYLAYSKLCIGVGCYYNNDYARHKFVHKVNHAVPSVLFVPFTHDSKKAFYFLVDILIYKWTREKKSLTQVNKCTLWCYRYRLSSQNQDVNLPSVENVIIHPSLISNLNEFINLNFLFFLSLINLSSFPIYLFLVTISFPIFQTSLPHVLIVCFKPEFHFLCFSSQSSQLYVTINIAFSLESPQPHIQ